MSSIDTLRFVLEQTPRWRQRMKAIISAMSKVPPPAAPNTAPTGNSFLTLAAAGIEELDGEVSTSAVEVELCD